MLNTTVFNALNNPGNSHITPGTDRIRQALNLLDNPQDSYKVIHITGTNGKGSTAAFIETGLYHAGYRVGKFSSPHIKVINECICLDQQPISNNDLESNFFQVQAVCVGHHLNLSPFELLTALMFKYFATAEIDYLVLEVGMGGQDDATNVVNSLVSIITNISLEHTRFLGDTLAQIAVAKSGIIKHGLTIIADNAHELIDAVKSKTQTYINVLDNYNFTVSLDYAQFHTLVEIDNHTSKEAYTLNLFGRFQAYNFLCAYHTLKYLNIPTSSISYAAVNTQNPGRLQVIGHDPLLILDATHNLAGANQLADSLQNVFNPADVVIISSILADKDVAGMLQQFSTIADNIICTTIANNPRALPADYLSQIAACTSFEAIQTIDEPLQALHIAKAMGKKLILITGSLYLLSYFY